jgi:hypothetical protein
MAKAAQKGAAETVNMVARVGRASRLGERVSRCPGCRLLQVVRLF